MRPYSVDLRRRILADYDAGMGVQAVAEKYRVSTKCIRDLRRLREQTGQIGPRTGSGGRKLKLAEHLSALSQLVEAQPAATLEELQRRLPIRAGLSTNWRALEALGLTLKKSPARL
jgi:transposase